MNRLDQAGRHARNYLLITLALLAGCARESKTVTLAPPPVTPAAMMRSQNILLRDVTDERGAEKPLAGQQALPEAGDAGQEEEETLPLADAARAIGRGPSGPAREAGDIMLTPGQTVEGVVRQALENTFKSMGYGLETDEGNVSSNDMIVDVTIDRFWGAETPGGGRLLAGAGGVSFKGAIETTLQISGPVGRKQTRQIAVKATRRIEHGVVTRNWQQFFQSLLNDYATAAKKDLRDLPQP